MTQRHRALPGTALPAQACLPINRCNLPCHVLGGLAYQQHPAPLAIDGVAELHRRLFDVLDAEAEAGHRATHFANHMRACFHLENPAALGYDSTSPRPGRIRADYRRLLRGWLFNPDGYEAAVIKGWVESRFGLQTRHHGVPLYDRDSEAYARYQGDLAKALYNTSALLDQLDLLYSYCQYELARNGDRTARRTLYRGLNRPEHLEQVGSEAVNADPRSPVLLLNNVNSFSASHERADEFGDQVIAVEVPCTKLLWTPALIPGVLQGEDEHLVIGGLYRVTLL